MTEIRIVCQHPKKVARIDTFVRQDDGTWGWRYAQRVMLVENDVFTRGDMRQQDVVVPAPGTPGGGVDWERVKAALDAGEMRDRYRLECNLCGPKSGVTFIRSEKFYRRLDRIAAEWPPGEPLPLATFSLLISRQG